MADAPYTPDTEDVEVYFALGLVEYSPGNGYDLNAAHDGFRRWLAAHVASEVERLADETERRRNEPVLVELDVKYAGFYAGIRTGLDREVELMRARAAEIREGKN